MKKSRAFACLLGAMVVFSAAPVPAAEPKVPRIEIAEERYALGTVVEGTDAVHVFELYQSVKNALPKGEKLSDYIVSINLSAEKSAHEILPIKYKELAAIAASITAHCQPCFSWHLDKARQAGACDAEIDAAVSVGKAVQKGANAAIESFVNENYKRTSKTDKTCCCD